MYDISTRNVKKGKKFFSIFLVAGLLFLVVMGGFIISNFVKLNSLDSKTTSTRVEISTHRNDEGTTMYSPDYYYEVDGVEYMCGSNSSSNINPGNDNKTVYYDSKNPSRCMTEYSKSSNNILIIFLLLPLLFIGVGAINIRKVNKRIKAIDELNKKGKLVKGLPYHLEDTGMATNGVSIKRPVVDYTLPTGSVITLYGDPRHDRKSYDADGLVDLVIDESNPDNYFIDFEINRKLGNQASDYYKNPEQNTQAPTNPTNSLNNNQQVNPVSNQQPFMQPQNSQIENQQNYFNQNNNNI